MAISISQNLFTFSSPSSLLSWDESLDSAFNRRTEAGKLWKVFAFSVSTCSASLLELPLSSAESSFLEVSLSMFFPFFWYWLPLNFFFFPLEYYKIFFSEAFSLIILTTWCPTNGAQPHFTFDGNKRSGNIPIVSPFRPQLVTRLLTALWSLVLDLEENLTKNNEYLAQKLCVNNACFHSNHLER